MHVPAGKPTFVWRCTENKKQYTRRIWIRGDCQIQIEDDNHANHCTVYCTANTEGGRQQRNAQLLTLYARLGSAAGLDLTRRTRWSHAWIPRGHASETMNVTSRHPAAIRPQPRLWPVSNDAWAWLVTHVQHGTQCKPPRLSLSLSLSLSLAVQI